MPQRVTTIEGKTFFHREFELPPVGPTEVRVAVDFAAPKHGTEGHSLSGTAFDSKVWDPELRLFLPRETPPAAVASPSERGIGNMVVGVVAQIGGEVTRWKVGDRVFGYGQIAQVCQADEAKWYPQEGLTPVDCVCVDPAHVAFVAVRDGKIRIGDTVAVYGLGAIGLMAVQIARVGGARKVFAVDPLPIRRECAMELGADAAFDPTAEDAALQIKLATQRQGVDVSIETSGNARALHDAIRCIRQCGTVVHVPWGPKDCAALRLDEEFHLNRPTIVGSQAWVGWGCADRSYPLWDHARAYDATIELFRAGLVTGEGIVHPVVAFADVPERFARLFPDPAQAIKLGVAF